MKRPPADEVKAGHGRITWTYIAECETADEAMSRIGLELRASQAWMENEMKRTERGWEITLGKWVQR